MRTNPPVNEWAFNDPPNVAVLTTRYVLEGKAILLVCRYEDDGSWGFYSDDDFTEAEGRIVSLQRLVVQDASITALADLPYGWGAERDGVHTPWRRMQLDDTAIDG